MALRVVITGSTPRLGLAFQFVQLAIWLRRQGVDVVMAGCDGEATPGLFDSLREAGIPFHDVPGLQRTGVPQLLRPAGDFKALLQELQPDVAIITAVGHLAETRGLKRGHPSVVWWLQSVRNTKAYAGLARRVASFTVNRRADQAWVQCELERRYMTGHGMREEFTRLVPTPVDVQWWRDRAASPLPVEFAEVAEAKAAGRPILVYPASLLPAKRHDTLFRAAAIVKDRFPTLFVCCPGRFSAAPLNALADTLGLRGHVMFTESLVRQEAIPPLLGAADVHVFPSAGETYGKALIEAWCIGTPTVCTRVGVGWEAERAGVAKVCDVGDHEAMARWIVEILSDPALAVTMRKRSMQWVDENYSFEAVGQRMISLMEELVGRRGGRALIRSQTTMNAAPQSTGPLRVVILAHNLRAAGGLAVGRNVVSSLSRVRPQHSYLMFLPAGVGYEDVHKPPNSEVHYVERRWSWLGQFLFESRELPRLVRAFRADRIWGLGNFGLRDVSCPQAVLLHKPHYVYGADSQRRERWRFRLLNKLGRRRLQRSLPATSLVFCQSETICERFRRSFDFSGRVSLMPSAVSELVLKGDPTRQPAVFDRLVGRFVLLCVTKYYAHKNLEVLADLMAEHGDALNDVSILVTVEAKQHPNAGRFIDRLKEQRFHNLLINVGPIHPTELAAYFARCAGLILPTLLETFGLPYLEAMQLERPILTSDLDFARDVCGPAARYFDPLEPQSIRDAILELKSSSTLRDQLVAAGRTRMQSFFRDWDSIVGDAIGEIEALVATGR